MTFPYEALDLTQVTEPMTDTVEFEQYDKAIRQFALKQMRGECDHWRGIEYWAAVLPELVKKNPKLTAQMLSRALDRQLCAIREPFKEH